MLGGCIPSTTSDITSGSDTVPRWNQRTHSLTTWYITSPEESLQLLKEEKTDDAVYSIYVKKVNYHSSLLDRRSSVRTRSREKIIDSSKATLSNDLLQHDDQFGKAHLQWRLEEVRVLRYGTVEHLVRSLASDSGDLDSSYVNAFLATYRAFATTPVVLDLLLKWYKTCSDDPQLAELKKEGRKRSIRTVLSMWLDIYLEDFYEPPAYSSLSSLRVFSRQYLPESDFPQRCQDRIARLQKLEERLLCTTIDDIAIDVSFNNVANGSLMTSRSGLNLRSTKTLIETASSRHFAEQLTCIDAELYKKLVAHQCLGSIWSRRHDNRQQAEKVSSVYATIKQFNAVSHYVVATILQPKLSLPERACVIERWINVAQELRLLKNFSSLKSIISGLQSISVYRLRRTWLLVNRSKNQQFEELAQIFSDEDNQRRARELLYREGTAKFADPETEQLANEGHRTRQTTFFQSLWHRRTSTSDNSNTVQGTVPYLGIFLTDLMMIDSALKDTADDNDKLINFDKRRKEFEILTQIRLWQSAAGLYHFTPSKDFQRRFSELKVYDETESYAISCQIETDIPSAVSNIGRHHTARRQRRDSSLGSFQRRTSQQGSTLDVPIGCWPSREKVETQSLHSYQDVVADSSSSLRPQLRHSSSVGLLINAKPGRTLTAVDIGSQLCESVIARVYLQMSESEKSSHYKSILLNNCDHTSTVLQKALTKYDIEESLNNLSLHLVQRDHTELELPADANVFYAIDIHPSQPVQFIVRTRSSSSRRQSQHRKP